MSEPVVATHDAAAHRFQVALGDELALLEYGWLGNQLALMHTEVPAAHEGKGIAAALAKTAFEYAKTEGKKVVVYCPYVAVYLKRHPEYQGLVVDDR
jgi:uncharacterized protein